MTNDTALAMVSHLDSLVLDYVHRRPKNTIVETSLFHKTVGTATENKIPAIGGLTLEHIYSFYFIHNPLFHDVTSNLDCDKSAPELKSPVPRLPSEVVEQIFELCDVKQLIPLRILSRRINKIASKGICQQAALIVNLSKRRRAVRFSKYYTKRRFQDLGTIFGAYDFECPRETTIEVLPALGLRLRFAQFDGDNFDVAFLLQMPNIANLNFSAPPTIGVGMPLAFILPKLKFLTLTADCSSGRHETLAYLTFWTQLAPNLRELNFSVPFLTEFRNALPHLLQYLRSNRYLNKISCWEQSISRSDAELEVTPGLYAFENLPRIYNDMTLPSEPPSLLPPLRHVTLHSGNSLYFGNSSFDTVRRLTLFDKDWGKESSISPTRYHTYFPRLHTLHLQGNLYVKNVKFLAASFGEVQHLKFSGFDRTTASATSIFDLEVYSDPRQSQWVLEWPISKFKKLKTLEFESEKSLRRIVLDVMRLTLQQLMQPLEQLIITYLSPGNKPPVEERNLFLSMHQLKYHKELNFKIIHSS